MFKKIRVTLLLYVLLIVAVTTWLGKKSSTRWQDPLLVVVYPINADGSLETNKYIDDLSDNTFQAIERFMKKQANHYQLAIEQPIDIQLGPTLQQKPPPAPQKQNIFMNIWWSLNLRWYAWKISRKTEIPAQVQLFVQYYHPSKQSTLGHSIGLEKGLVGVINAFSQRSYSASNNVVVTHELMHTLGATDKYDAANFPLYPIGFAEPGRKPLFPQRKAEIMAGRIPVDHQTAVTPDRLRDVVIGPETALEINWIQ